MLRRALQQILAALQLVETSVAVVCFVIATAAIVLDVILREVFALVTGDAIKLALYLLIVAGLLGLGLATSAGTHIRPRFADTWLAKGLILPAQRLGDFIAAAAFLIAGYYSAVLVGIALDFDFRIDGIDVPLWLPQSIMVYAFASNASRHLIFAVDPSLRPAEVTAE